MTSVVPAKENRRQAVRVTDRILLASKRINDEEYDAIVQCFSKGISLYNQEDVGEFALYLGAQAAIGKMREKDENLANFMQLLDAKVNRILAAVSKEPSPIDKLLAQEVNISGTGLAFLAPDKIAVGDMLELHLVLLPEYAHIYTVARAVSSHKPAEITSEYSCRVACEFDLIRDNDREAIVQHVFERQKSALRNRRLQKNR